MTNESGNLDPQNEKFSIEEFENLEGDALREKLQEFGTTYEKTTSANKQLFERAKKSEGELKEFRDKKPEKEKPDENLLNRLDAMAMRIAGVQADDEKELFNKWKGETGRDADAIIGNAIFQKELADLRTTKANADATNVTGGGSSSAAKGTLEEQADYWISKSTKDSRGDPLFDEAMPSDYKLHAAIVRKLQESSKDKKKFYNS